MEKDFINVLQKLVTEYGKDVLLNAKIAKHLLADYTQNEYKRELDLLLTAIEIGAAKEITNAGDLTACKKAQIRELMEKKFINETAAAEIIDVLAFVLRGDISASAEYQSPQQLSDYSQTQAQNAESNTFAPKNSQPQNTAAKFKIVGVVFAILCLLALGGYVYYEHYKAEADKADKLFEQALNAGERGDYQVAVNLFSQVIAIDPKDAVAYYNRAYAYAKLKNYDQAIKDYTKAIALDPKNASAYNSRGIAYKELQNYDQAIEDYTKAIELDPNYAFAYYNRGIAYAELRNYDQAKKDAKKACDLLGECELWNRVNR
ncbi:MAG: tetratricopeptide repeat protein [Helicobacteraceae bacterium]|jgi:tetratricopeptide (TPR) repeat protein|nr:tetratricopeptide repeat protein [Helicobacteraceae bacterium]